MPEGFEKLDEAQLHKPTTLVNADTARHLGEWWLPPDRFGARTPNFDIASTCTIEGKRGLILIESKAHEEELKGEACGRRLDQDAPDDRKASHQTIKNAIAAAAAGLSAASKSAFAIDRDSCYQMSNRFAWAWKLADLDVPVVLVYLGFLGATEMADRGSPFVDDEAWSTLVREHSKNLFPSDIWNRRIDVNGVALIPLIRTLNQPYDRATIS